MAQQEYPDIGDLLTKAAMAAAQSEFTNAIKAMNEKGQPLPLPEPEKAEPDTLHSQVNPYLWCCRRCGKQFETELGLSWDDIIQAKNPVRIAHGCDDGKAGIADFLGDPLPNPQSELFKTAHALIPTIEDSQIGDVFVFTSPDGKKEVFVLSTITGINEIRSVFFTYMGSGCSYHNSSNIMLELGIDENVNTAIKAFMVHYSFSLLSIIRFHFE